MGTKTGVIRFNVGDRGRKYRGQDRSFDTAVLADLINSGPIQEKVAQGDMLGYYGHWPRIKFGMEPIEGAIEGGKQVSLEPAIRTVSLKAYPDGTIEHEAEFLGTNSGKLAERLFRSKTGGFSSAIDVKNVGSRQLPRGFFGFDYVLEPNFTKNRGYMALDGVFDDAAFDEVSEYNALLDSTNRILDQVNADYDLLAETAARLEQENIELMSMLTRTTGKTEVVLDSLTNVIHGSRSPRFDNADSFLHAEKLPSFDEPKEEQEKESAADKHLFRRFGI